MSPKPTVLEATIPGDTNAMKALLPASWVGPKNITYDAPDAAALGTPAESTSLASIAAPLAQISDQTAVQALIASAHAKIAQAKTTIPAAQWGKLVDAERTLDSLASGGKLIDEAAIATILATIETAVQAAQAEAVQSAGAAAIEATRRDIAHLSDDVFHRHIFDPDHFDSKEQEEDYRRREKERDREAQQGLAEGTPHGTAVAASRGIAQGLDALAHGKKMDPAMLKEYQHLCGNLDEAIKQAKARGESTADIDDYLRRQTKQAMEQSHVPPEEQAEIMRSAEPWKEAVKVLGEKDAIHLSDTIHDKANALSNPAGANSSAASAPRDTGPVYAVPPSPTEPQGAAEETTAFFGKPKAASAVPVPNDAQAKPADPSAAAKAAAGSLLALGLKSDLADNTPANPDHGLNGTGAAQTAAAVTFKG